MPEMGIWLESVLSGSIALGFMDLVVDSALWCVVFCSGSCSYMIYCCSLAADSSPLRAPLARRVLGCRFISWC